MLQADLTCSPNPPADPTNGFAALVLRGGTLDLNGHTLTCDCSATAASCTDPDTATFFDGVWMADAPSVLRNSGSTGGIAGCNIGVAVTASKVRVTGIRVSGGDTGFAVLGSRGKFRSNVATGNAGAGFLIHGDRNQLLDNVAQDNSGHGFQLEGPLNKLKRNRTAGNDLAGVSVLGSRNQLTANDFSGNLVGIEVLGGAVRNKVQKNEVHNNLTGIWARSGSEDNLFLKNDAANNPILGLLDENGCFQNIWKKNVADSASPPCLQ